jgi:hypothetical protein
MVEGGFFRACVSLSIPATIRSLVAPLLSSPRRPRLLESLRLFLRSLTRVLMFLTLNEWLEGFPIFVFDATLYS